MLATGGDSHSPAAGAEGATIHSEDRKSNATPTWFRAAFAWYLRAMSRAALGALIVVLAAAAAAPAQAYEDQASFDAELAYTRSFASVSEGSDGVGIGVGGSLGLSDTLTLRGQLMWAFHPWGDRSASLVWLSADLVYVIDVLEVVPYVGLGVDGAGVIQTSSDFTVQLGVHPVFGVDYLLSREVALGLQVKPIIMLTTIESWPLDLQAGFTFSYLFDT
jgi:hypothetical protein